MSDLTTTIFQTIKGYYYAYCRECGWESVDYSDKETAWRMSDYHLGECEASDE